jgi:predicted glutamine amidotransferase
MCRLFISFNRNNLLELQKFYNHRETKQMVHGYGLGKYTNKWCFVKGVEPLHSTSIFDKFIKNADNINIVTAHVREIYDNVLTNAEFNIQYTIANTHPFQCGSWWLSHSGDIFLEQNSKLHTFQSNHNKPLFIEKIDDIRDNHIHKSLKIN